MAPVMFYDIWLPPSLPKTPPPKKKTKKFKKFKNFFSRKMKRLKCTNILQQSEMFYDAWVGRKLNFKTLKGSLSPHQI